jgi:hypothetical protein
MKKKKPFFDKGALLWAFGGIWVLGSNGTENALSGHVPRDFGDLLDKVSLN